MPSFYTVAQYVPDPNAGERINFGVLTFGDGHIYARFLKDWRRVRSFGGEDIHFLQEFASRVGRDIGVEKRFDLTGTDPVLTEARLVSIIGEWANAIQFTRPRPSTLPASALIDDIAPQFLRERAPRERGYRTRATAANWAFDAISKNLRSQVGNEADRYVDRLGPIFGDSDVHQYDVVLKNGNVYAAVRAISFETGEPPDLDLEVRGVAWDLTDVRKLYEEIQLAVVAIPPEQPTSHWDRLQHISQRAGAPVLTAETLPAWSERMATGFVRALSSHGDAFHRPANFSC